MIMNGKRWSRVTLALACALAIELGSPTTSSGSGFWYEAGNVAADVVLVRPAFLIVTVVGTAAFLVALPVTVPTKSVQSTGNTLVVLPARATFTRELGDLEGVVD